MAKARTRNGGAARIARPVPQLSWTPLAGFKDSRRWKAEVLARGGQPVGVFWAARKWPLATERPVRVGFAEWRKGLPEPTEGYELWQARRPEFPLMLRRSTRSMLFMYGSWWFLAMFLAMDVTRNLWVQVGLMGGGTLLGAWAWFTTIQKTRWILQYDPRRRADFEPLITDKGRR